MQGLKYMMAGRLTSRFQQPVLSATRVRRRYLDIVVFGSLTVSLLALATVRQSGFQLESHRDPDTIAKHALSNETPMRIKMEQFVKQKQAEIVAALEKVDGHSFQVDKWQRVEGGEGISCVLQNGSVFEKAGVNVSVVYGKLPPAAIAKMKVDHKGTLWVR